MCLCAYVFIHMYLLICSYSQYGVILKAGFSVNKKRGGLPSKNLTGPNHLRTFLKSLKRKDSHAERKRKPEPVGLIGSD